MAVRVGLVTAAPASETVFSALHRSTRPWAALVTTATPAVPRAAIVTSTLNESFLPVPTNFASVTTTLSGTQRPLLVDPACTKPSFAFVYDSVGNKVVYAGVGCGVLKPQCCPYGFREGVVLDHCPGDYTTQVSGTYRACCPMLGNYTLFSSAIAHQTPCASSMGSTVYVPAPSLLTANARLNNFTVFSYSFLLPPEVKHSISPAAIVAPVVFGAIFLALVLFWLRRQKMTRSRRPGPTVSVPLDPARKPPPLPPHLRRVHAAFGDIESDDPPPRPPPPQYGMEKIPISVTHATQAIDAAELDAGPIAPEKVHPARRGVFQLVEQRSHGVALDDGHELEALSPSSSTASPVVGECIVSPLRRHDPNAFTMRQSAGRDAGTAF